jgi:hypothetical protein
MSSTKSPSIPIAQSENYIREDNERYCAAMSADYRDLIFFARLVDGMRKQQNRQQNPAMVYQNQELIDHIIDTRRGRRDSDAAGAPPPAFTSYPFLGPNHNNTVENLLHDVLVRVQRDDMVFEMDL